MKSKALLLTALLLGVVPVAFIAWYRWDSGQNHGFEFGYYGDINRVRRALTGIPGVTITREWANKDVSVEEFGFDITTGTGQAIPLDFQESDPVRDLSGESLARAVTDRVQSKTALPSLGE